MLSSDRSGLRADHRRHVAAGAYSHDLWDDAQPFDPDRPWDDAAAEALMSLYESEEGRLWRPAAGERVRPAPRRSADDAPPGMQASGIDRAWLEAHLSEMAQQLKDAVARANPEPTLAALTGRLETIEQQFGATLGRATQPSDQDALRALETRVRELAAQLEQTRERLDHIGSMDVEVRALAQKAEEAGALRTSGLEKLLRDLIAEWREGEQRTASALQHIEEAIGQLGETLEALEASKPAPELSVPPLTGAELGTAVGTTSAFRSLPVEVLSHPALFQTTLDAADYAPKPTAGDVPVAVEAPRAGHEETGRPAQARLSPGALRIMALRAKLRQRGRGRFLPPFMRAGAAGERLKRAGLSVLLMAGAALATGTYYLYRGVSAPAGATVVAEDGGKRLRQ